MKTDTELKARIRTERLRHGLRIMAVSPGNAWLATLLSIDDDGKIRADPGAQRLLKAQGYTLPGAKWGAKGEILVQTD